MIFYDSDMRVFYKPIALTEYEVNDIARAIIAIPRSSSLCHFDWCIVPKEMEPDVYISHLRCVDLEEDLSDDSQLTPSILSAANNNRYIQRLVLDENGQYKQRPMCLLGEDEENHHAWRYTNPKQAADLHTILYESAHEAMQETCVLFALSNRMVALRDIWKSHNLIWKDPSTKQILAVACVRKRKVWLRPQTTSTMLEKALIRTLSYARKLEFESAEYQELSFWQLLWDYVQRCSLTHVHTMLTPRHWNMMVRLHRTAHLPKKTLPQSAKEILRTLSKAPAPIYQVMQTLQHEPEELLRTIVGLLFTRVVTFDKTQTTVDSTLSEDDMK